MKNIIVAQFAMQTLILLSSCNKTAIEGTVTDAFGNPIGDVVVRVEGTQFSELTDDNGQYSVGYVPGDIKVLISKQGYTDTSFSVKIAAEALFPAEPVVLYGIPDSTGFFFISPSGYVALTKATLSQSSKESVVAGWLVRSTLFCANYDNENVFTVSKQDAEMMFFDNEMGEQNLFKIITTRDGRKGLLERNERIGGYGFGALGGLGDNANFINETYRVFKDELSIRKSNLDAGDYAFVHYNKKNTQALDGSVYVIRVTD